MIHSTHRQGGWSFLGLLGFLLVGGIFLLVGFKLAPIYGDHYALQSIIKDVQADRNILSMDKREILRSVNKKVGINYMNAPKDFLTITKDKGSVTLDLEYEVRVPIFANVDAVVSFKEQYIGRELD